MTGCQNTDLVIDSYLHAGGHRLEFVFVYIQTELLCAESFQVAGFGQVTAGNWEILRDFHQTQAILGLPKKGN